MNDFCCQLGSQIGGRKTAWPFNAKRSIWTARIGMVERQTAEWQRYSTPDSRRCTVAERDQKDRRVFARVRMYAEAVLLIHHRRREHRCRLHLDYFLFLFLSVCLHFYLVLSLPSRSQHIDIDSPAFAVAVFIRELRLLTPTPRPIGSEHLISRPASSYTNVLYSSCNKPTSPLGSLSFTNQYHLFCRSLVTYLSCCIHCGATTTTTKYSYSCIGLGLEAASAAIARLLGPTGYCSQSHSRRILKQ
jgi:hypothetical protein